MQRFSNLEVQPSGKPQQMWSNVVKCCAWNAVACYPGRSGAYDNIGNWQVALRIFLLIVGCNESHNGAQLVGAHLEDFRILGHPFLNPSADTSNWGRGLQPLKTQTRGCLTWMNL